MERQYEKYVNFLKELSYPVVSRVKKDEWKSIFEGEKRLFLFHWILKELNINVPFPDSVQAKVQDRFVADLATLLESCGFCRGKEKLDFVTGKLHFKAQEPIFDRIFHKLTVIKDSKNGADAAPCPCDDTESAEYLLRNPTEGLKEHFYESKNLFPSQGPILKITAQEREALLEFNKELIDELTNQLSEFRNADVEETTDLRQMEIELNENMANVSENFDRSTRKFLNKTVPVINMGKCPSKSEAEVSEELQQSIAKVHSLAGDIAQFSVSSNSCRNNLGTLNERISKAKAEGNVNSDIISQLKNCMEHLQELDDNL